VQELKPDGVENEAAEQADVLVVNKVDLASGDELASLTSCSKSTAPPGCLTAATAACRYTFDLARTLRMDDQFLLVDQEHHHDTSLGICLDFIADQFQSG